MPRFSTDNPAKMFVNNCAIAVLIMKLNQDIGHPLPLI